MKIALLGKLLGAVKPNVHMTYRGEHRFVRVESVGTNNKTNIPYVVGWDFTKGAYRTFSEVGIDSIDDVSLPNTNPIELH